jgi:hypothetical protein
MRKVGAATLGIVVVVLSVAVAGEAQGWIQVAGTIQAFDCQANSLVLSSQDGVHVFPMAPNAAVFINGAPNGACALRQFAGSYAVAAVSANGGQFFAGRVDVYTSAAVPPPAYYAAPYYPYYWGPPYGIGIGIGVGGGYYHGGFHGGRYHH